MKIVLYLFVLTTILFSESIKDIEKKISSNQKEFKNVLEKKSSIDKNINLLADKINKEESDYEKIVNILNKTNTQLLLNRVKLTTSIQKIEQLQKKSNQLKEYKEKTEKEVVDFAIEKYALGMGIKQTNKTSLQDVVDKEVYTLVFDNVKQEIMELNIAYLKINKTIRDNEKKIKELNSYIQEQNEIKAKYKNLVNLHEKTLTSLKSKHGEYQRNLQKVINKQNTLNDLLGSLNILKKEEIKKEKDRKRKLAELARQKKLAAKKRAEKLAKLKAIESKKGKTKTKLETKETSESKPTKELVLKRKDLDDDIDIEVRKLGSSVKGIKISKYYGKKTMAPLKSYTVTKKFGKYYDKVYKMELFNESVALKTKIPNAKVFSIFKGQVVYAKQNSGLLENVVIVKHQNSLHTIYSHLDKIAPTLKVGKWIPKGYVVGRVNDTLEFQATKNSKYIDPLKLIK
jgi:murein DD-endopeptidase MepM/ murein hydrolase activator NlpD